MDTLIEHTHKQIDISENKKSYTNTINLWMSTVLVNEKNLNGSKWIF